MVVKSIFPYYILEVLLLTFPLGLNRVRDRKRKKKKTSVNVYYISYVLRHNGSPTQTFPSLCRTRSWAAYLTVSSPGSAHSTLHISNPLASLAL